MAQNDILKRYIDAGLEFAALTQARAEELVKDLVKAGEVQADQARDAVAELLERSRKSSEKLLETVRTEVRSQITNLGLASQADLDRIEQRIASLLGTATAPAKKARRPQGPGQEGAGQEGAGQEGGRQEEGAGQEAASRQEGLSPWRAAASTPSWCGGAWRPAASRPSSTSPPAGSPSAARRPTRRPASSTPASRSACSGPPPRFVGRGGEKLDAALERFDVDVAGRRAYDLGASTGGFTDCLLQRGAASVVAVDVGLRPAPRAPARRPPGRGARAHEHPRRRRPATWARPPTSLVADLSFISLRTVLPGALALGAPGRRPRAAGEAPVRGGTGGGGPGQGRDHRPGGVAPGARGGRCRARRAGSRHHGRDGVSPHRRRRQRRVPRSTPAPRPRPRRADRRRSSTRRWPRSPAR